MWLSDLDLDSVVLVVALPSFQLCNVFINGLVLQGHGWALLQWI